MAKNETFIKNPLDIQKLSGNSYDELVQKTSKEFADRFILVGPKKYMIEQFYEKYQDEIYNMKIYENDVWIVTHERSGTTLTKEMIWLICNDMDFEKALSIRQVERFPFFDLALCFEKISNITREEIFKKNENDPERLATAKRLFTLEWEKTEILERRFIKSHLPLSLLPHDLTSTAKVVYVARNPKSQLVSQYHFYRNGGFAVPERFEDYVDLNEKGLLPQRPYFEHVKEGWNLRNQKNILFMFYEDIIKDTKTEILKMCEFFGKTYTNEQINKLMDYLKVENFKKNSSIMLRFSDFFPLGFENNFIRTGKVDSFKEEFFTKELNERTDKWIEEQYKKTDMRFPIV